MTTKTEKAHLHIHTASHPGMRGKKNEDRFRVTPHQVGKKEKPAVLAVLCDGIGGHRAGEVAAEMGVTIITDQILSGDPDHPLVTIENAVKQASQSIYEASQTDKGRAGMGATCALAWVIGDRLYTANMGDSRIYLLREGHFIQLSTDHTWVQEAMDAGIITDADSYDHPNAHVIRRYLGSKKAPQPDFRLWFFEDEQEGEALNNQGLKLKPDDIIFLCSDGLTDLVSDNEIRDIIQSNPPDIVPTLLIELANTRGGHDNTTMILMETFPKGDPIWAKTSKRRWITNCLAGVIFLAALIVATFLGVYWLNDFMDREATPQPQPTVTNTQVIENEIVSATNTASPTPTVTATAMPPQFTLTPWPTHTTNP